LEKILKVKIAIGIIIIILIACYGVQRYKITDQKYRVGDIIVDKTPALIDSAMIVIDFYDKGRIVIDTQDSTMIIFYYIETDTLYVDSLFIDKRQEI